MTNPTAHHALPSGPLAPAPTASDDASHQIIRKCVHCGFCNATCPTYLLTGDELDGPRGRIYLIKGMLASSKAPSRKVVHHLDRCLSCLACMTTCPSGVNYMHLVDQARAHIEQHYRRPLDQQMLRQLLAWTLPHPRRFRLALQAGLWAQTLIRWIPIQSLLPRSFSTLLSLLPHRQPTKDRPDVLVASPRSFPRQVTPKQVTSQQVEPKRVALLPGCVQQVLAPHINDATRRLLHRHGVEVMVAPRAVCCGALTHHLGKVQPTYRAATQCIDAWYDELDHLDAIVVNASGCGTMLKDYGFMFRQDAAWKLKAARISERIRDLSEWLCELGSLPSIRPTRQRVCYHAPCSAQHGQKMTFQSQQLLREAGFQVVESAQSHICCGSAGSYNILQPVIAGQLREQKLHHLEATASRCDRYY